ncbi:hypothetical protein FIV00_18550 [Labrenzia sp. THAF82]|nr:hypothetical protein FIV00_18550 [Labrenzia sp. THAF82]
MRQDICGEVNSSIKAAFDLKGFFHPTLRFRVFRIWRSAEFSPLETTDNLKDGFAAFTAAKVQCLAISLAYI